MYKTIILKATPYSCYQISHLLVVSLLCFISPVERFILNFHGLWIYNIIVVWTCFQPWKRGRVYYSEWISVVIKIHMVFPILLIADRYRNDIYLICEGLIESCTWINSPSSQGLFSTMGWLLSNRKTTNLCVHSSIIMQNIIWLHIRT